MTNLKYIQVVICFFIALVFTGCKKTSWVENFREKSKAPFGTYIVYNELGDYLAEEVVYLKENIYDYLYYNYNEGGLEQASYVCIKRSAFKLKEDAVESLLSFVADGNEAFISLNYFNDQLKKRLHFEAINLDENAYDNAYLKSLKGMFYLVNETFKKQAYVFNRNVKRHYFSDIDKATTIVLGHAIIEDEKHPNFIKVYYGKGAFYLHANPIVFTNYYLLKDNEAYAENILSYLPNTQVLWDPQVRSSKFFLDQDEDKPSIFKFFLKHETLTWFLYVFLGGILLFMLFNARRKQRVIPIIKPLENTTVAFTQTIASLYMKEENHKRLAEKKIKFFFERVRATYMLDTHTLNIQFIESLAAKSGNDLQKTKYLIFSIIEIHKRQTCSEEQLIVLHKMITNFFNS